MKALVQVSFAVDGLSEDDLLALANEAAQVARKALAEEFEDLPQEADDVVDWYGVSITLREPIDELTA